jgi:predicted HD superfamily hydrolase involved in NAD metabolism
MPTLVAFNIPARLAREMTAEALAHSQRTAELARELAVIHGVDPDRAELAALIHDLADGFSDRQLLERAEKYGIPVSLTEARVPKLLHGAVGAEILREEWGITDEELLDAVRYHISGNTLMTQLAKVLFVADKLEPHRDRHYGGLNKVRELAQIDLDQAILQLYAWRVSELVDTGRQVHEQLVTARNVLLERVGQAISGGADTI